MKQKKLWVNLISIILIVVGIASMHSPQMTDAERDASTQELPMVIYPIQIEEVDGEDYFAFTSDDEGLYFTQDDVLTDGSKYEVGDVAYAYYAKDPEGRENTFIAVMDY